MAYKVHAADGVVDRLLAKPSHSARFRGRRFPRKRRGQKRKPLPGQARRAKLLKERTPKWADELAINAIYAEARRLTYSTGTRYEVDHIIPLNGATVSGLHVETNLQILPALENRRKHAKVVGEDKTMARAARNLKRRQAVIARAAHRKTHPVKVARHIIDGLAEEARLKRQLNDPFDSVD